MTARPLRICFGRLRRFRATPCEGLAAFRRSGVTGGAVWSLGLQESAPLEPGRPESMDRMVPRLPVHHQLCHHSPLRQATA